MPFDTTTTTTDTTSTLEKAAAAYLKICIHIAGTTVESSDVWGRAKQTSLRVRTPILRVCLVWPRMSITAVAACPPQPPAKTYSNASYVDDEIDK